MEFKGTMWMGKDGKVYKWDEEKQGWIEVKVESATYNDG